LTSMNLQTRIFRDSQLVIVEKNLKSILEGLDVEIVVRGIHGHGWVEVLVSGQDERVATRFLAENVGFCPKSLDDVHVFSVIKGFVADLAKSRSELRLDIGFASPSNIDAIVPLRRLQAQLGDGRKIALNRLVDLFGLCQNMPLYVRVLKVDAGARYLEVELSEKQGKQFTFWVQSLLDRLLILGSSSDEVREAMKSSGVGRDVVGVESLGMFEHAVVCKLGTDAVGLVPKIGRILRSSTLNVFNARKIVGLLGEGSFSFGF
jgi:hypothetical protein